MRITAEKFKERVGTDPIQDDLERCNCQDAGKIGHEMCGWDVDRDMPRFVPGDEDCFVRGDKSVEIRNISEVSTLLDSKGMVINKRPTSTDPA